MKAASAAPMEAAAVPTPIAAAMESSAVVIARTPIDAASVAVPPIITTAAAIVTAGAVKGAAVVRRAVIAPGIDRRDITRAWVDAGLITTGEPDCQRGNDRAKKNPTANHGFSPT
jgi:hypothetical protein